MKFTEFNFKPYIQEALKEINFREATEVQEKTNSDCPSWK